MIIEKVGNVEDFFDDLSELKSKNKRNGGERIIQCLSHYGPLRNSEIAKHSRITAPSVTEALKTLKDKGLVSEENGKFKLTIDETIKTQIFEFAKTNDFKIDELVHHLIKENKKAISGESKTPIVKILMDKESTSKIKAIADVLSNKTDLYRTGDKKNPTYHISAECCSKLGLCYVCKTPINDGIKSCIINHTLKDNTFMYGLPLTIHATCIDESYNQDIVEIGGDFSAFPGFCKHCGLPLSEKELRDKLTRNIGRLKIIPIVEYLSKKEKNAYENHIYKEVIKKFKKEYNVEIDLSILKESTFNVRDSTTRQIYTGLFHDSYDYLVRIPMDKKLGKQLTLQDKEIITFFVPGKGNISFDDIDFENDNAYKSLSLKNELPYFHPVSRSILDEFFELLKDGGYSGSVERIKELHNIFKDLEQQKDIEINELIDSLFKDPISKIYGKIYSPIPTPYEKMSSVTNDEWITTPGHSSLGYGRIMMEGDMKFHPYCYHERKQNQESSGMKKPSTSKKKESKK